MGAPDVATELCSTVPLSRFGWEMQYALEKLSKPDTIVDGVRYI